MRNNGIFITLEGGECSGKTTFADNLEHYLVQRSVPVVRTREPGGTVIAEEIRQLILSTRAEQPHVLTDFLLMCAARHEHVRSVIKPSLIEGKVVICDRYSDSTIVYQGILGGLDKQLLFEINGVVTNGCCPHMTFLFDLDPKKIKERLMLRQETNNAEQSRWDRASSDFHLKIREGFLRLAEESPGRFVTLDATLNPENLLDAGLQAINNRWPHLLKDFNNASSKRHFNGKNE